MNIAKQTTLFGIQDEEQSRQTTYTTKIKAPIYEAKNKKPHIMELCDPIKTRQLVREIEDSHIPQEEKEFFIMAAQRHTVFNYEKIADYYAHSSKEVQGLMEKSALVIIDFGKAIELGYVRLCDEIREQYSEEENE